MDKPTAAVAIVQQLGLLQVLFMLPVDVLRTSFAAPLSAVDLRNFCLTCKEACQHVGNFTKLICIKFCHTTPLTELVGCLRRFPTLAAVQLQLLDSSEPTDVSTSFFATLLYRCRLQFRNVTEVVLVRLPVSYATSLVLSVAFPELNSLTLSEGCTINYQDAVFEPLPKLASVSIDVPDTPETTNQAVSSLFALPNLQRLVLLGDAPSFLEALTSPHCSIKQLYVDYLSDEIMAVLPLLPRLEEIEVDSWDFEKPFYGKLPALKRLKHNSGYYADELVRFVWQPRLQSLDLTPSTVVTLDVLCDFYIILHTSEWPAQAAACLQALQRLPPPASFPTLCLRAEGASAEEVTRFVQAWPVVPECKAVEITCVPLTAEHLRLLAAKLPQVATMQWDCTTASDEVLHLLLDFPELQKFNIVGDTRVTSMGITLLAGLFAQRAVQIGVSASKMPGAANLEWANAMLERQGVRSRFVTVTQP